MHASPPSDRSSVVSTVENRVTPRRFRPRAVHALARSWRGALIVAAILCSASNAHASIFQGEMLDNVANVMSWVVLVIAPVVGIIAFWLVHILPEKIAEKRKHPQTQAIQTLCLLSLFFGGLLWPLAWLWAYSKPVLYKLAYGTDVDETVGHGKVKVEHASSAPEEELKALRQRVAELEAETRDTASEGKS